MKLFRLKADVTFKAYNILDAFVKLSEYYGELAATNTSEPTIFTGGEIEIAPVQEGHRKTLDTDAGTFTEAVSPRKPKRVHGGSEGPLPDDSMALG